MSAQPTPSFVGLRALVAPTLDAAMDEYFWQRACELRVAVPAIVQAVYSTSKGVTVDVQPAIQENLFQNLVPTPITIPVLEQVPVAVYGAGGFMVTLPVAVGDECLIVFADMCINSWRVSGGVQNQEERRRHDLSDGIALFGLYNQTRAIGSYSASALQVRSLDGNTVISVSGGQVTITPDGGTSQIKITPGEIDLTATAVKINGTNFHAHIHSGVTVGSGDTGPVFP